MSSTRRKVQKNGRGSLVYSQNGRTALTAVCVSMVSRVGAFRASKEREADRVPICVVMFSGRQQLVVGIPKGKICVLPCFFTRT